MIKQEIKTEISNQIKDVFLSFFRKLIFFLIGESIGIYILIQIVFADWQLNSTLYSTGVFYSIGVLTSLFFSFSLILGSFYIWCLEWR